MYKYVDESRAEDSYSLPDVEISYYSAAELRNSAEDPDTLWADNQRESGEDMATWAVYAEGWYYAYGLPGCLWDSDPMGPYATEKEALAAAREEAEE